MKKICTILLALLFFTAIANSDENGLDRAKNARLQARSLATGQSDLSRNCYIPTFAEEKEPDETEVFFFRQQEVEVPIIMYHLVTDRPKFIGKHGITPQELEKDLTFLREAGYNTIVMQDLINFVERGKKLPKNPIVLTFDDGNFSDYSYLFPLLQENKQRAVVAIIGEATDRCTNLAETHKKLPNLTWPQVKELHDSGLVEIQNHGYNVHGKGGSGKKRGESADAYHNRLTEDLTKLQEACEAHLGWQPTTFVYPLGVIGEGSREIIEAMGMAATLGCEEGINTVRQGDRDCLFKMRRINRPSGKSLESILEKWKK